MAEAKKGKKTGAAKKGSKPKKKSAKKVSLNFFSKIMLTLLLIAVIACAIFMTLSNFNNKEKKVKEKPKQEVSIKHDNKKKSDKDVKTEVKIEDKKETKTEVKSDKKTEVKKEESKLPETEHKKEFKELKTLNGCWLSNEQGASITIDDYGYRIDFFGVDASKPITGNYSIEKNLIVFTSDGSDCNGVEGSYRITFYKKNISLICIDDKCSSRKSILEADWEWIEI